MLHVVGADIENSNQQIKFALDEIKYAAHRILNVAEGKCFDLRQNPPNQILETHTARSERQLQADAVAIAKALKA